MKILVTGANGFVGSHLLPKLIDYDLKVVVRKVYDNVKLEQQIIYNDDLETFKNEINKFNPNIVIHLASFLSSADDCDSIKNIVESNILFTSYLLESLKETNVELFINTGTFAEYYYNDGKLNPSYFYAASKIATRPIIKYFKNLINFKNINIVPYTIYGGKSKNKKVIDYIIESANTSSFIDMTSGEQILDFIHIDDVIDFYIHCINNIDKLEDEEDYHLGTGIGTTVRNLAVLIENKIGKKTNINWGAKEYRSLDVMRAVAPVFKLEKELEWKAKISLEDGIKKIINGEKND